MKRLRLIRLALVTSALAACDIAVLDPITRPKGEAPKGDDDPSAPSDPPPYIDKDAGPPPPDVDAGPLTSNPACSPSGQDPNEIVIACGLSPDTVIVAVSPRHIATIEFHGKHLRRIDRVTKQIDTIAHANTDAPDSLMAWGEGSFTFSESLDRLAFTDAFPAAVGARSIDLTSGAITTLTNSGVGSTLTSVGTDVFFNAASGRDIVRVPFLGGAVVAVAEGERAIGTTGPWTYYLHYVFEDRATALSRVRVGSGVRQEIARNITRWNDKAVVLDSNGGAYFVQRGTLEEPWRMLHVGPDHPNPETIFSCWDVDHCGDHPAWVKLHRGHVFASGRIGSYVTYGRAKEFGLMGFVTLLGRRGWGSVWFEGDYMFEAYVRGGDGVVPSEGVVSARPLPPLFP